MTQDEIIEMARRAGFETMYRKGRICGFDRDGDYTEELEAFAKLVEAHTCGKIFKPDWDNYRQGLIDGAIAEREACAKVCEDHEWGNRETYAAEQCAVAIRERGEA